MKMFGESLAGLHRDVEWRLKERGLSLVSIEWTKRLECNVIVRTKGSYSWTIPVTFPNEPRDMGEGDLVAHILTVVFAFELAASKTTPLCGCGHPPHSGRECGVLRQDGDYTLSCRCKLRMEAEDPARAVSDRVIAALSSSSSDVAQHDLVSTQAAEIVRLKDLLDRDRTGLVDALDACRKAAHARYWIVEGRGSYRWDDERYRHETGQALREIGEIAANALSASGKLADAAFHPNRTAAAIEHANAHRRSLETDVIACTCKMVGCSFGCMKAQCDKALARAERAESDFANACDVGRRQEARADRTDKERSQ